MANEPVPSYDTFVVRLWRAPAGERLLRAEIDHVQTGAVFVGRDVPPDWILATLHASVRGRRERSGRPDTAGPPAAGPGDG